MYRRHWNRACIASPKSGLRTALLALALLADPDGAVNASEEALLYAARAAGQPLPEYMAHLQSAVEQGWLTPIKSCGSLSKTQLTLPEGAA